MNFLLDCLEQGTSPAKVVAFARDYLEDHGFAEFGPDTDLKDRRTGRYYMAPFPDVLFAFTAGDRREGRMPLRIGLAHVDQPGFKIKGKPDFKSMGCSLLNVGIYGGMMDHTWFDRPLGLSGQVALRGESAFEPRMVLFDSLQPVAVIPGLAIHMDRGMNDGWKIDRQKELMPVTGLAGIRWNEESFLHYLADELGVDASEILSYDLNLYNYDKPLTCGIDQELISSPRLDNLVSVAALLEAIVEGERNNDDIHMIALFNHEEVGSRSKSGANSVLFANVIDQIYSAGHLSKEAVRASLADSYYLSLDGAHAAHPNYPDRCDPTTRAYLGQGLVMKVNGSQKYASDCKMQAILKGLSEKYDIPLQEINDRNTIRGGTTIGPIVGGQLSIMGCDIGVPMLSMHSARELMCAEDYESLFQMVTAFFVE